MILVIIPIRMGIWEKLAYDKNFVFPRSTALSYYPKISNPTLTKHVIYFAFFTFLLCPLTGVLMVSESAKHGGG